MNVELQTKVIQKYFVIIGSNLKSREGGEGEREKHMKVMKYNFEILFIGTIMTHLLAPAATVFLQNIFYHLQYGHNKLGVLKGRD